MVFPRRPRISRLSGGRGGLTSPEPVDAGVFQQRTEYHHETGHEKDVDTLEVRDLGQRGRSRSRFKDAQGHKAVQGHG